MKNLEEVLSKLIDSKQILGYCLDEQVPSIPGDYKTRLIDRLSIQFRDGSLIKMETVCSGCLENTSLELVAYHL